MGTFLFMISIGVVTLAFFIGLTRKKVGLDRKVGVNIRATNSQRGICGRFRWEDHDGGHSLAAGLPFLLN